MRPPRFTAHCRCGESIDYRSGHVDDMQFMVRFWEAMHRDPAEHGPVTPAQAGAIRRRLISRSRSRATRTPGT